MKFWLEVFNIMTDDLLFEKEVEFEIQEDAEIWAHEQYNTDCYACISESLS